MCSVDWPSLVVRDVVVVRKEMSSKNLGGVDYLSDVEPRRLCKQWTEPQQPFELEMERK